MIHSEHLGQIRGLVHRLVDNLSIDAIPKELFAIGLAAPFDSCEAVAAAEDAIVSATGLAGLGSAFAARQLVARFFIGQFANESQKRRWMPAIANGELWPAIAISEPNVGAHPKHLSTTATPDGDGYLLRGRKIFVTNGMRADLFLVLAVCEIQDGRKSYGLFAVPREAGGFGITPMTGLEVLAPSTHAEMTFENCRVSGNARIGGPEDAYSRMALPFRDFEDGVAASNLCGLAEWLVRRVARRMQHNHETLLDIGQLAGLIEVARAAASHAAELVDRGGNTAPLAIGIRALVTEVVNQLRDSLPASDVGGDRQLRDAFAAFELLIGVARKAREARRADLGATFLGRSE